MIAELLSKLCHAIFNGISSIEQSFQNRMGYIYAILGILTNLHLSWEVKNMKGLNPMQLIGLRGVISILILHPVMNNQDISPVAPERKTNIILYLRGIISFVSMNLGVFALVVLSVAENAVLGMLGPPLTGILAWIFLGEPYTKSDFYSALFSFLGVLFIVKPELMFFDVVRESAVKAEFDDETILLAQILLVISIVLGAVTNIILRQLGGKVHSATLTWYFCFFTGAFCFMGLMQNGKYRDPYPEEWPRIIKYTVSGLVCQVCIARSYAFEKASKIALVSYLNIIFSFMMDVILFDVAMETYHIIGISMILACFFVNALKDVKVVDKRRTSTVYSVRFPPPMNLVKTTSMIMRDSVSLSPFKRDYGKYMSMAAKKMTQLRLTFTEEEIVRQNTLVNRRTTMKRDTILKNKSMLDVEKEANNLSGENRTKSKEHL